MLWVRPLLSAGVSSGVIYSIKRRHLFVAADGHNQTPRTSKSCLWQQAFTGSPKRTEQDLIVRTDKSEAEVTNNERLLEVLHGDVNKDFSPRTRTWVPRTRTRTRIWVQGPGQGPGFEYKDQDKDKDLSKCGHVSVNIPGI